MRTLVIAGLMAGLSCLVSPAMAAGDSQTQIRAAPVGGSRAMHRWGPQIDGRWQAGTRAPGGWVAYRNPAYGFPLPRYWIQPDFFIPDYGTYGLPAPHDGFGWSRYYDDAVLTDRYGRVYDSRHDMRWDRYEGGHDDADERADRGDDVGDGVAGHRAPPPKGPPPGRLPYDDSVTSSNEFKGHWVGTWYGDDGRVYSGDYDGSYRGTVRGADVGAPPTRGGPHWMRGGRLPYDDEGYSRDYMYYGGGAGGYYYAGPGTTVIVQPGVVTTTTYIEEDVVYSPRKKVWKPRRTKPRCVCK